MNFIRRLNKGTNAKFQLNILNSMAVRPTKTGTWGVNTTDCTAHKLHIL